jgi:hypothetical protein
MNLYYSDAASGWSSGTCLTDDGARLLTGICEFRREREEEERTLTLARCLGSIRSNGLGLDDPVDVPGLLLGLCLRWNGV